MSLTDVAQLIKLAKFSQTLKCDLCGQDNIETSVNCHDSAETTAESNEAFKQNASELKKKRRFQNESNLCAPCYI